MASATPAEMNSIPKRRRRLSFESEFLAAIEDQSVGHGLNIGCCMETHGKKIGREEFAKLFKERILDVYPRYRSRILIRPSFLGLDVNYHLEDLGEEFDALSIIEEFEACEVPRRYPQMTAVEALLEATITQPFGDELPPLRFYLVHNDDGGTTIISKLHHALADGFSSIMALLELTDTLEEKPMQFTDAASVGSTTASDTCVKVDKTQTMKIGKILRRVLTLLWQWLKHVPWALYMLLVFSVIPDSYTSLRPTWAKRGRSEVRSGKEVSLDDLKIVAKATGSKINDVILALLAGTARRYLLAEALKRGNDIQDPARLRMGFQFTANMRSLSGEPSIGGGGNESWVFAVPVCLDADLEKRIQNVQLQTGRLKQSPAFLFGKVFTRCCGFFMNFPIFRRILINCICGERYLFGKTLTVTNVPGPRAPRSVCGEEIRRMLVYVSHSQTFSVITYNGKVSTIIVTDSDWVDAELMRECYNEEVEQAVIAFRSTEDSNESGN